jgi:hypothetical protein
MPRGVLTVATLCFAIAGARIYYPQSKRPEAPAPVFTEPAAPDNPQAGAKADIPLLAELKAEIERQKAPKTEKSSSAVTSSAVSFATELDGSRYDPRARVKKMRPALASAPNEAAKKNRAEIEKLGAGSRKVFSSFERIKELARPLGGGMGDEMALLAAHDVYLLEFQHAENFGMSRRVYSTPQIELERLADASGDRSAEFETDADRPRVRQTWNPGDVELVGLLRHESPVVYSAKKAPWINELAADEAVRHLDDFESDGLKKLLAGEEIVFVHRPGAVRALGAIRAGKDCLSCHRGKEGGLLGAFSFRFVPAAKGALHAP